MPDFLPRKHALIWILLAGLTLTGLFVLWWLTPVHGLQRVHTSEGDYLHEGRWLWATIDGDSFSTADGLAQVNRVRHRGSVFVGAAGSHEWRLRHSGNLTITVDDEVIFASDDYNDLTVDYITFDTESAWVDLEIDTTVDLNTPRTGFPYRTEMQLQQRNLFGQWSIIPYYRLYPEAVTLAQAQRDLVIGQITQILLTLLLIATGGLIVMLIWHNRHQRLLWLALAIMGLSLIVRLVIWWQRSINDPLFYFLPPAGDDNYVLWAQQWLSGQYQLAGTFWPPTPIVFNAMIVLVFGPQLWKVMIVNIVLSVLATGAVTLSGWLAFTQKHIGTIAGLLFALFPPLIFYQTTSQSVVLDAAFISFAMTAGLLAIKRDSFVWAALFGFWISIAGMSRGTALLLGLAFFFALMMRHRVRGIQLTAVAAIVSVLTLMPQIVANASATGEWSLVPYSNGSLTLYSGNNRDASGLWTERGMAWEVERLSGADWYDALLDDFQDDPRRLVELNLRKFAMFWNNIEYVSNVNYYQQGIASSNLLRLLSPGRIPGMFLLSALVFIGITELIQRQEREAWFILWSIALLVIGTVLFVLAGRLRMPVMPYLMLAAAAGLSGLWQMMTQRRITSRRIVLTGMAIALFFLMPVIERSLPRKNSDRLSENAIMLETGFFNEIALIAHDPVRSDFRRGGYFYLSLYWQPTIEASQDYRMFIELADDSGRVVGMDRQVGDVSYPPLPATEMTPGSIYREGYLLRIPENAPDVMSLNVGLYPPDNPDASERFMLFQVGVIDADTDPVPQPPIYQVGEQLAVTDIDAPRLNDNQVLVDVTVQANTHIADDVVIFTHVLDTDGALVAQVDSPLLIDEDKRTVSSLVPGIPSTLQRTLILPDDLAQGTYSVVLGAYRFPSIEPFVITDNRDTPLENNVIVLGTITYP